MPVGVPKVLYYWDDELPLQWIDLYNLIFRRRLVFVMSELDQDLCNQIAGMMVYIHFEDKRKELEKKGVQVVDLFEQSAGTGLDGLSADDKNKENAKSFSGSYKLTYQDLMDYDTIWDFEAGIQRDYYMDIYNSFWGDKNSFNMGDYMEYPLASYTSNFSNNFWNLNSSLKNETSPILRQQSNLFNVWLTMLPIIAKYKRKFSSQESEAGNSALFRFLNSTAAPSFDNTDQLGNFFGKAFYQKIQEFNSSNTNILGQGTNNSQTLKSPQEFSTIAQYLEFLQNSTNKYINDRTFFKEIIKRAHNQDFKNQNIADLDYSRFSGSSDSSQEKGSLLNQRFNMTSGTGMSQSVNASKNNDLEIFYNSSSLKFKDSFKKSESEDFLYSETQERMQEQRRVFVFINSTGGSVTSGITIYDALQFVKAGAVTVCLGMAFSASSMVLAGGNIGHRYVAEGGHVMIHQPEGGITGQASDVLLDAHEIMRVRRQAATIYTLSSKRSFHEVLKDLDRDYFMTPQEAIDYGLADEVVTRYNAECILDEFEKDWLADDAKQLEGISKKIQQFQDDDEPTLTGADPRR
uniref:ATP-dependent Clp protease proteolytic subunit n=1 Tax=Koshicola spirodelophila TaxID=1707787 RepID=A0A160E776_9CHLO|nr:proteolytic subunit 2 of clp protease [Koshicola spirodelophila]